MRRFSIYNKRLVRISDKIDKITMLDWLLHLFGIHLIRESSQGIMYCRICDRLTTY